MEDSCFNFKWQANSFDDQLISMAAAPAVFGESRHQLLDNAPLIEYYDEPVMEPSSRPSKQLKIDSSVQSLMNRNLNHGDGGNAGNQTYYVINHKGSQGSTSNTSRATAAQDHILAERKRRERLSQKFIALSALLPNLKKMDKASVLGDAIEYMKTLQEKVKILENQRANIEAVRYQVLADGGAISSSDERISSGLPEIRARFSGKDVLIRVHCEKKTGVVQHTLAEIEKLQLSVINSTAVIFANSALHITVIAQVDKDLTMTVKDLVKNLSLRLKQFK